jgi:hypothetical protein
MGTSSSNKGSPSNVPMIPQWVLDVPNGPPDTKSPDATPDESIPPASAREDDSDLSPLSGRDGNLDLIPAPFVDKARLAASRSIWRRTNLPLVFRTK